MLTFLHVTYNTLIQSKVLFYGKSDRTTNTINMFKLEKLATLTGFRKPTKYAFDPSDYIGYKHTMTHQDESALENHDKFATWEFTL